MNFKDYFDARNEEAKVLLPQEESFTPDDGNKFQQFKAALSKNWGKEFPKGGIFTSELVSRLGFNIGDLLKSGIIKSSMHGNYELNKDLEATGGVIKQFQPPQQQTNPAKPMDWKTYMLRMQQASKNKPISNPLASKTGVRPGIGPGPNPFGD